jgi:hypothetical protein
MQKRFDWRNLLLPAIGLGFFALGGVMLYVGYADFRGTAHPTCNGTAMSPGEWCETRTSSGSSLGGRSYSEIAGGGAPFGNVAEMVVGALLVVFVCAVTVLIMSINRSRKSST